MIYHMTYIYIPWFQIWISHDWESRSHFHRGAEKEVRGNWDRREVKRSEGPSENRRESRWWYHEMDIFNLFVYAYVYLVYIYIYDTYSNPPKKIER